MQTWELKSDPGSAASTGREEGSTLTWSNNLGCSTAWELNFQ